MAYNDYRRRKIEQHLCRGWPPGRVYDHRIEVSLRIFCLLLETGLEAPFAGAFLRANEPCRDARYAMWELTPEHTNIGASVYGEAATSTGAKRTEMSAW